MHVNYSICGWVGAPLIMILPRASTHLNAALGPGGQEISIDCCTAGTAAAPGRSTALSSKLV